MTLVSRMKWRIAAISAASAVIIAAALCPAAAATAPTPAAGSALGRAVEIAPPPQNSNTGRDDSLTAVSCPQSGECAAVGTYFDQSIDLWPMVTALTFGGWGPLTGLHMPDDFVASQFTQFNGVSCAAPGRCAGVGSYRYSGGAGHNDAFVATAANGSWHPALAPLLPGNAARPARAGLSAVACTGKQDCVAVGNYTDKAGNTQLMVVAEIAGTWRRAREITAPRHAKTPVNANASGVSCFRTGSCVAVGGYISATGTLTPLTFSESGGRWHRAIGIGLPANALTGKNNGAGLSSVSCTAKGFCAAVGSYLTRSGSVHPMALTGSKGLAGHASEITAAPSAAGKHPYISELNSVSCVSAGRCVAVGDFERTAGGSFQAMALTWKVGHWGSGQTIRLPFDADTSNMQIASLASVSCTSHGFCVAVGGYVYVPDVNLDASAMAAVMP